MIPQHPDNSRNVVPAPVPDTNSTNLSVIKVTTWTTRCPKGKETKK
jgi:hypothetical protein